MAANPCNGQNTSSYFDYRYTCKLDKRPCTSAHHRGRIRMVRMLGVIDIYQVAWNHNVPWQFDSIKCIFRGCVLRARSESGKSNKESIGVYFGVARVRGVCVCVRALHVCIGLCARASRCDRWQHVGPEFDNITQRTDYVDKCERECEYLYGYGAAVRSQSRPQS